jgi:hypothetical protein
MTPEEYLSKSAEIKQRLEFVRWEIDAHVLAHEINRPENAKPLLLREREIILEILALEQQYFQTEYFNNA